MPTFVARVDLAPPIMTPNPPPADRLAAAIIQTWLDGTAAPDAAAALAKHPELAADKALALDLAFAEFLLREHGGEQLDPDEFCARFPDYHASLGRMLAQQSIRDRADLDAVLPGGLAHQTINVDVQPLRGAILAQAAANRAAERPDVAAHAERGHQEEVSPGAMMRWLIFSVSILTVTPAAFAVFAGLASWVLALSSPAVCVWS